jgi:hypothetical protein
VIGSDQQVYTASFGSVADGTNFSYGNFTVSPGTTEVGWVAFQVPDGVAAASVQWSAGFNGQTATWTVSK